MRLRRFAHPGVPLPRVAPGSDPLLRDRALALHDRVEFLPVDLAAAHREIAPEEETLELRYLTKAEPLEGEGTREALRRRLADTAQKEQWNGVTLAGPHRDDIAFVTGSRDLAAYASRGQQRTAILAFKLAELELLGAAHGRPPLLLLDEATSALDAGTEEAVQSNLAALCRGVTSLVVAHRLSTVTDADVILVLDEGRIVERGSHAELLERGGLYADLWARQSVVEGVDQDERTTRVPSPLG